MQTQLGDSSCTVHIFPSLQHSAYATHRQRNYNGDIPARSIVLNEFNVKHTYPPRVWGERHFEWIIGLPPSSEESESNFATKIQSLYVTQKQERPLDDREGFHDTVSVLYEDYMYMYLHTNAGTIDLCRSLFLAAFLSDSLFSLAAFISFGADVLTCLIQVGIRLVRG